MTSDDVVICGGGPAGRALAHRCLARGLSVTLVDPAPDRRWRATYGVWADELPDWLPGTVVAATVADPIVWGRRRHRLDRPYAVLDTDRLFDALALEGAHLVSDHARTLDGQRVVCASGRVLSAHRVIDARGLARAPDRAEQTAYGLVLTAAQATGIEPVFMDWRDDHGARTDELPSFLYAVPLGGGRLLVEETCLVGRPALDPGVLRQRLEHRMRARGVVLTGGEAIERVRFPMEGARPRASAFGAAGGFIHPATGYSIATALACADPVAMGAGPTTAMRMVALLRALGLRTLLALPPTALPDFFDAFFALSPARRRAYLSGYADPAGTAAAMSALFATLPSSARVAVVRAAVGYARTPGSPRDRFAER